MGRMGVPEGEALDVFKKVSGFPHIRIHSVSTHLPVSDEDADYTRDQLLRFGEIMKQFRAAVPGDFKAHVLQSAGVLAFADPQESSTSCALASCFTGFRRFRNFKIFSNRR